MGEKSIRRGEDAELQRPSMQKFSFLLVSYNGLYCKLHYKAYGIIIALNPLKTLQTRRINSK